MPVREKKIGCTCGATFDRLQYFHAHLTKEKKNFGKIVDGKLLHPNPMKRPKDLIKIQKQIHQEYNKLVLEEIMARPSKELVSTMPMLLEQRKKKITTSQYQLRNRKIQGKSKTIIAKEKKI